VGERLTLFKSGDYFAEVSKIMGFVLDEYSLYLLICAVYPKTTSKYGERGIMYVHDEVGHAALNAMVEYASLNLVCEPVVIRSTFTVKALLELKEDPLLLLKISGVV
jgi:hypothetical protein